MNTNGQNTQTNGTEDAVATDLNKVVEANAPKTTAQSDSDWVKSVRKKLNLTQQEFCAKAGVSQGLVSQVEKGTSPMSKKFKAKIEALLAAN